MNHVALRQIENLFQEDVGNRGLRSDAAENLISATEGDFEAACRSLIETNDPRVGVVTGFFIPQAEPPAGETDGPLGAVFLARALVPLGFKVTLAADDFCERALRSGLQMCALEEKVRLIVLPPHGDAKARDATTYRSWFQEQAGALTHLIALERCGPSHTEASLCSSGADECIIQEYLREVPAADHGRCRTMRGLDITEQMSPAHWLFEEPRPYKTIGIGDGGNEIGMGKIPWRTIRRNIPRGGLVACRIATDQLIVSGISNWGAYGLAAGICRLHGGKPEAELWNPQIEETILRRMVESGPLVDGVLGRLAVSVDGLEFGKYAAILPKLWALLD